MTPSITQLIIVAALVLVLFKSKDLPNIASDLASALRNWKKTTHNAKERLINAEP